MTLGSFDGQGNLMIKENGCMHGLLPSPFAREGERDGVSALLS
jgi:hypothetical protein